MKRKLLLAAAAACLAMFLGAATGSASSAKVNPVKDVGGWLDAVEMNGANVAYSNESASGCRDVVVWNVLTGATTTIAGPATPTTKSKPKTLCGDDEASGQRVVSIALNTSTVEWVRNISGNTEADDYLFASPLKKPKVKQLASAKRTGEPPTTGSWLGGLAGSGSLLVANWWTTDSSGVVTDGSLRSVSGSSLTKISDGAPTVLAQSASAGKVAVLHDDGTVGIYDATGALTKSITPSSARLIALDYNTLAVVTKTKTVEIYSAKSGKLLHVYSVPSGAANIDVSGKYAVFSVWRKLYVMNLGTGKTKVLVTLKRAVVTADIEKPGVVYTYNNVKGIVDLGHLVFTPMSVATSGIS